MVIELLITLDWNIFHIYFLLMVPIILQGHSLQLMDSKLETSKTPTPGSDIYASCLRDYLIYFKFGRNRDLLHLSFLSRFNSFVPWICLEAGWVFSVYLWIDLLISGGKFFYHEYAIWSCTSETIFFLPQPRIRGAGRRRQGQNCICIWDSFFQTSASTRTHCFSVYFVK